MTEHRGASWLVMLFALYSFWQFAKCFHVHSLRRSSKEGQRQEDAWSWSSVRKAPQGSMGPEPHTAVDAAMIGFRKKKKKNTAKSVPNTDKLLIAHTCVVSWVSADLVLVFCRVLLQDRCRLGSGLSTHLSSSLEWQLWNSALPVTRQGEHNATDTFQTSTVSIPLTSIVHAKCHIHGAETQTPHLKWGWREGREEIFA